MLKKVTKCLKTSLSTLRNTCMLAQAHLVVSEHSYRFPVYW